MRQEAFVLPELQKAFWSDWRCNPSSRSMNIAYEYRMDFAVSLPALIHALEHYVFSADTQCACRYVLRGSDVYCEPDAAHLLKLQVVTGLLDEPNSQARKDLFFFKPFDLESDGPYRFLISKNKNSYSLLVCFHHIILDSVTHAGFLELIAEAYNRYVKGLEPLRHTFSDIDAFRFEVDKVTLDSADITKNFTADSLHIDVAPDRYLRETQLAGRSIVFKLDGELFDRLKEFVDQSSVFLTVFRVVLAAYASILKFYSNCESLCIVFPLSQRTDCVASAHAAFSTMSPLSIDFHKGFSLLSLINEINTKIYCAKKYKTVTYPKIVAALRQSNLVDADDFSNICISESLGLLRKQVPELVGGSTTSVPIEHFEAIYDLCLGYAEYGGALHFQLDYDSSKFSYAFVERFVLQYQTLLEALLREPEKPVSLSMLGGIEDYKELLGRCVSQTKNDNAFRSVIDYLAMQSEALPNHIALQDAVSKLSYADLDILVNKLAEILYQNSGNCAYKLIGVCLDPSVDLIVFIISALKAGLAYVPIDPRYPAERFKYIVSDSKLSMVVTTEMHVEKFMNLNVEVLLAEELLSAPRHCSEKQHCCSTPIQCDELAYIIYTSGSTGKPKGVKVTHGNLVRLFETTRDFEFSENDVWCLFHSTAFDFSVWEIWGALFHGGTLKIVPYTTVRDPRVFHSWIKREKITVLNQTPSAFQKLVEVDSNLEEKITSLRYVIFGGEALKPESLTIWTHKYGFDNPKLINMYGITETTVHVTHRQLLSVCSISSEISNIGRPLGDLGVIILNQDLELCPVGVPGEICVFGAGLSLGYLHKKALTAERFINNPYAVALGLSEGSLLYRSGDRGRLLNDGTFQYLGRIDKQVKIRGFRIELGEIESIIQSHDGVQEAVVIHDKKDTGSLRAYYAVHDNTELSKSALREFVASKLPSYMLPKELIEISEVPVNQNGKLSYAELDLYAVNALEKTTDTLEQTTFNTYETDLAGITAVICGIWREVIGGEDFSSEEPFFNIGGDSFSLLQVRDRLEEKFKIEISIDKLFQYTTINELACFIDFTLADERPSNFVHEVSEEACNSSEPIAIIGMACKVPGVEGPNAFWSMLVDDRSSIREFTSDEICQYYQDDMTVTKPGFVNRGSVFDDVYAFDAEFFGYTQKEAQLMDPQQRWFLTLCWEALEHSGTAVNNYRERIGVFASQGRNFYALDRVYPRSDKQNSVGDYQSMISNEKDFLSSKVSYRMNLTGPSMNIQTGCSSSLLAVKQACQSLRLKECDTALCGGVSIFYKCGFFHVEGMIESADGYCRPFDSKASGTVPGSGAGVVVLKRLSDAIREGDKIYAVIKGISTNNDGANKMSYTAPSVDGQVQVIQSAQAQAGVQPNQIEYIEGHGTATLLGDPIEVSALNTVFESAKQKPSNECLLGSVKARIGHTDAAAGVLGLITAALALERDLIPGTLNFEELNPEISRVSKHLTVTSKPTPWRSNIGDRYAGVSSFGIGGTNVHAVLQGYHPHVSHSDCSIDSDNILVPLSAKSSFSLSKYARLFEDFLTENGDTVNLQNVAYTMQEGREEFSHRGYFVAINGCIQSLVSTIPENPSTETENFMLSVGPIDSISQLKSLYKAIKVVPYIRESIQDCEDALAKCFNIDISISAAEYGTKKFDLLCLVVQYSLVRFIVNLKIKFYGVVTYGSAVLSVLSGVGLCSIESCFEQIVNTDSKKVDQKNLIPKLNNYLGSDINIYDIGEDTWKRMGSVDSSVWARLSQTSTSAVLSVDSKTAVIDLSKLKLGNSQNFKSDTFSLMHLIGDIWVSGGYIEWELLRNKNIFYRKCALPTYAFNKKHFEIEPTETASKREKVHPNGIVDNVTAPVEIHSQLRFIWSEVLGLKDNEFDEQSDFFSIGGDSLALVDLLDKLNRCWQINIEVSDIFDNLKLIEMINLVKASLKEPESAS